MAHRKITNQKGSFVQDNKKVPTTGTLKAIEETEKCACKRFTTVGSLMKDLKK